MRRLSLVVASGGNSLLRCVGFSLQWLLLVRSRGSRHARSVVVARGLWRTGSVAVAHGLSCGILDVGSSWPRARTHVPCIGRWIFNHCATREVLSNYLRHTLQQTATAVSGDTTFNYLFFIL